MELIPHNLSINFLKHKNTFIVGSIVLNLAILLGAAIGGLNWGVDFKGGAELEVQFKGEAKDVEVRKAVQEAGFEDATVQLFGAASDHSFLIRIGRISLLSTAEVAKAKEAVTGKFGANLGSFEFNPDYGDKIELRFKQPIDPEEVRATLATVGIKAQDGAEGIKATSDKLGVTAITAGISTKVASALGEFAAKGTLPQAELRRVEFVGPQVGKQLRTKGILAVLYAAIAILLYIALRFDTRFAPGAIVAMFHDVIVVLGYYVVTRREFNLTSVAVLLTIVGYSVNDTIVVYDRIRENLAKAQGAPLTQVINGSINQTMSRTILTSATTVFALVGLLIFGVGQIWDFAAAMFLGIFVGTYSSIFIASPVTIFLEEIMGKSQAAKPAEAK